MKISINIGAGKKVTMPNVNEGSVIEYEYTVRSSRISELKVVFSN
jgi:hypothetical protein